RRAGTIKVPIEADDVALTERAESGLAPDAPAPNAVPVVNELVQRLRRDRTRIVRLALRFLDDDLELATELAAVDQGVRVRVGLHVEAGEETGRGQHGVVDRVVVNRRRVQVTAGGLRLLRDLADTSARRALEVHVLEHVRDADDVVRLVEVAGAHIRDDR